MVDLYPELTIDERVNNGLDVLDIIEPGWEFRVNPWTLDMADNERCVGGQLAPGGSYYSFLERHDLLRGEGPFYAQDCGYALGLSCHWRHNRGPWNEEYARLTRVWRGRILTRRQLAGSHGGRATTTTPGGPE